MAGTSPPRNGDQETRRAHIDVHRSTFTLHCECGRYLRFVAAQSIVLCQCGRRWQTRATLELITEEDDGAGSIT